MWGIAISRGEENRPWAAGQDWEDEIAASPRERGEGCAFLLSGPVRQEMTGRFVYRVF